jgi:hypothetical protein
MATPFRCHDSVIAVRHDRLRSADGLLVAPRPLSRIYSKMTLFDSHSRRGLAILIALALAGCSSAPQGPQLVPVEGIVILDGKPLGKADLIFVPLGQTLGQGGVGQTDAAGKFELSSHDRKRKGASAGSYRVVINKLVKPDGTDFVPNPNAGPMDTGGFREMLPTIYSDMGQSQLTAEVPEGGAKNLELKLSSKLK